MSSVDVIFLKRCCANSTVLDDGRHDDHSPVPLPTHMCSHTHPMYSHATHSHLRMHALTPPCTHTHISTCIFTHVLTRTPHVLTCNTFTPPHTCTHSHPHAHMCTHSHAHTLLLPHACSHMCTHSRPCAHSRHTHSHTRGPGRLCARPAPRPCWILCVCSSSLGKRICCQVLWGEAPNKHTAGGMPPPAGYSVLRSRAETEVRRSPGGTTRAGDPLDLPQGRDSFLTLPVGKELSRLGLGCR